MAHFQTKDGTPLDTVTLPAGGARDVFLWGGGPDNQALVVKSSRTSSVAIAAQQAQAWPLFKISLKAVAPGEAQIQGLVASGEQRGREWVRPLLVKVGAASPLDFSTDFVHPKPAPIVRLALFWTTNSDGDPAPRLTRTADDLLTPHGLLLRVSPGRARSPLTTLAFQEQVSLDEHVARLRQLAAETHAANANELVVIFCRFRHGFAVGGITVKRQPGFANFVLIDTGAPLKDGVTLLHEVGHSAGADHTRDAGNVMFDGDGAVGKRRTLFAFQVKQIANAFFTGR